MLTEPSERDKLIDRGARIDAFLNDPIVQEAIEKVRRGYYERFSTSSDVKDRDMVWAQTRALKDVEDELRKVSRTGETAQIERAAAQGSQRKAPPVPPASRR